ncbi:hypothetical protein FRC11_009731 [Ceratobasidium sp. 423]|nr:hypothetical protein FRC11_009731 [Ceratobasidium sp. 423]
MQPLLHVGPPLLVDDQIEFPLLRRRGPTQLRLASSLEDKLPLIMRGRGGRPYQAPRFPTGGAAPPPPDSNNHRSTEPQEEPPEKLQRKPNVDFGVVRNDAETQWGTYDLLFGERAEISNPTCRVFPIKHSRKGSVKGFIFDSNPVRIANGYRLRFAFKPQAVKRGVHVVRARVGFTINGNNRGKSLRLKGIIGDPEDHAALKPVTPYKPLKQKDLTDDWQRGPMLRNKPNQPTLDFGRLPFYDIPHKYWRDVQRHAGNDSIVHMGLESLLPTAFNIDTYKDRWTHLLWHEEIAICNKLKQFDMKSAPISHLPGAPGKYTLKVPGLEEKRPSVIVTDLVAIRKPRIERPVYGGYVTDVRQSEVVLQLHEDFPGVDGEEWEARFTVNRVVLRRMHDSVGRAEPGYARVLFPESTHQLPRNQLPRLSIDRQISTNPRQKLAVERIISMAPGDIPFIIFGPPGTGKTTVVVEAIHQVMAVQPTCRILVCAPSNSAADLLAQRLGQRYKPKQLLRLNAPSRSCGPLYPTELKKFSCLDGQTFTSPPKEKMMEFKIVVSTCSYASVPRALGVENHFTHIFIDEAGHAAEPELMIAVLQNISPTTNVILSGDPKQLGPIVQSGPCIKEGMAISFLERLTQMPVYSTEEPGNREPNVVKLVQNYRNHPAILRFPNETFYGGELQACATPLITNIKRLDQTSWMPQPGFPIIFHSICGENQREGKSPSYFNIDEATLVKRYVKYLLDDGQHGLSAKHIGVIAPYRQQCDKIRRLLSHSGYGGVDVKVTEDWQGQERRVIIVSTVRSDPEMLETDSITFLGFVASMKRTNVALTRAQALLIVIGFGPVLQLDPVWYGFLKYVHESGGCKGDELLFGETYDDDGFEEMRRANPDYMDEFDEETWDGLQGATRGWGVARS